MKKEKKGGSIVDGRNEDGDIWRDSAGMKLLFGKEIGEGRISTRKGIQSLI